DHDGAFATGIFVNVFIRKEHGPAVSGTYFYPVFRPHPPYQATEVFYTRSFDGTHVLLLDIGIFIRVPSQFLLLHRVRIVHKDWSLVVVMGESISVYTE